MTAIVLASSPLVGPDALAGVGTELSVRWADSVTLPEVPPDLDDFTRSVGGACDAAVLVGFSAAGPRLFHVAASTRPSAIVFLDARLPTAGVAPDAEPAFAELLDSLPLAADGTLPPWSQWWAPDVMAALLTDPDDRGRFAAGCPRTPRSMFSRPIPAPAWDGPVGYIGLGDGYATDAAEASRRGWPVTVLHGAHHLWPVTEPVVVAESVHDMIDRLFR